MEATDVLIVGAGPAGLLSALTLSKYGVKAMIVERREIGAMYGNADTIQPGTIEMLETLGLRERFMKSSRPVFAYAAYSADDKTGLLERQPQNANVVVPDTRYPYELGISIEQIEGILREAALEYGATILQPWVPTMLHVSGPNSPGLDCEYPIEVTISRYTRTGHSPRTGNSPRTGQSPQSNGGSPGTDCGTPPEQRTIRAKYVIGCDGAHSWVRDAVGLRMEKAEQDEQAVNWGVVTFTPETDFPDTMVKAVIATPVCGMISWMPRSDGKGRLYVPLSSSFNTRSCTRDVFLEAIQSVLDDALKPYTMKIKNCEWISAYKVVQSVAEHFSVFNRVFVAGDAAYTHSAKTGQGANAAMKDAYNLTWKLAFVLRGWASPALLETYESERRAYARELIALDQEIALAIERGGDSTKYRSIWDEKNRFITGVGVIYHSSTLTPITQPYSLASRLMPGERLPPAAILRLADWHPWNIHDLLRSDCTFKLLLFPGEVRTSQDRVAAFADILLDLLGEYRKLLRISSIFSDMKVWPHWTDIAEGIRDPLNIFVDDAGGSPNGTPMDASPNNVYQLYDIAPVGCALLIRPDLHISLVAPISKIGAKTVADFMRSL